jgi:hypothetical protein
MRDMLSDNEDAHLASATSTERERLEREIRETSAPPSPREDRRIAAPGSKRVRHEVGVPASERSAAPSIATAPMSSPAPGMQKHESGVPGTKRMDLGGTATLVLNSGEEIGSLKVDLEAKNG